MNYVCDLTIPTYMEKQYIERTLFHLTQQNLYKKGKVHIIISDYKNELNIDDDYLSDLCKKIEHVTYIPVFRRGIAFARNVGFIEGGKTEVFLNFDADSVFAQTDGIDHMIAPILDGTAVMTNCETILFDFEKNEPTPLTKNAFTIASNIGTLFERSVLSRGPGMTISKEAFLEVNGFRDVAQSEDYLMAIDIIQAYGILRKRFIDKVQVLTSDRRAKGFENLHPINWVDVLDYNKTTYR